MSTEHPDVELVLPAEPESVALARQMVRGILDALGWGEESRTDISIAVTEAVHQLGAPRLPRPDDEGEYEVHAWVEPERLVVAVRDRGRGITPTRDLARGGARAWALPPDAGDRRRGRVLDATTASPRCA